MTAPAYPDEPAVRWRPDAFDALLDWAAREQGCSDIKAIPGEPVWAKRAGRWQTVTQRRLTHSEIGDIVDYLTHDAAASDRIRGGKAMDFAHQIAIDRGRRQRWRANATACAAGSQIGVQLTLRVLPELPPRLDTLELEADLQRALYPDDGLILITGRMGSGKSTLLAAVLRNLVERYPWAVTTYEAPIEFDLMRLTHVTGPLSQVEIPTHYPSFAHATRSLTRQSADAVLVGEANDAETIAGMLEATEVGITVYATLHTRSVAATPARLIHPFAPDEQHRIAAVLVASARVIVQQRLLPRLDPDTGAVVGQIPVREYLVLDRRMRRRLQRCRVADMEAVLDELVHAHGQPLARHAEELYEKRLIPERTRDEIRHEMTEPTGASGA